MPHRWGLLLALTLVACGLAPAVCSESGAPGAGAGGGDAAQVDVSTEAVALKWKAQMVCLNSSVSYQHRVDNPSELHAPLRG